MPPTPARFISPGAWSAASTSFSSARSPAVSYGYYNLSGGTNNIVEYDLAGFNGAAVGVCDISSGVLNVTNWFVPSRGTAAIGILNLTGGAFNYYGPAGQFEANWNSGVGTAVLNIANASLIASNANVNMMQTGVAGKLGEINLLAGGLLQANSIAPGSATGTSLLNFNGGTLKANAATATFLTANNTAASVFANGGTIDNNGVNITIPIALQAPAGSGINSSVTVSGGSGYIGAPAVTFTNGGGTGAAGYATISGGAVSGIVVTSPGINYSTAPTVVLSGGGGTGASATAPAPTANTSGGMTFTGTGTTTLSAGNTYTGNTTVSNGTLLISGSVAGNAVVGSGILNVSGSVAGGVTVNGGSLTVSGGSVSGTVTVNPGGDIAPSTGTFNSLVTLNAGSSAINLLDGTASTNTFQSGLALNNGNQLSFDLGSAGSDQISVSGGAFAHSGTVSIILNAIASIASGTTYTIITDAANDIITTNGFVVGTTPSGYNAILGTSGGALTVTITQNAPSTAYWKGGLGNAWNTVSGGNANWTTDAAGTVNTVFPPSSPTAVTFAAAGAANFSTTLGGNFTINSLTLSTANNIIIAGAANSLAIISGLTNASTALNNAMTASNVILNANQTWENDSANPLTVSSLISGASGLNTAGAGVIVLNNTNTYTGGTTISAGTLQLGSATGGNGSIPGSITNNGLLLIANPTAQTFSGAITGSGELAKSGAGVLTLPGANSYTGGTLISSGTVQLNNYNAFGTASEFMTTGTVTNNGTINLNIGGGGTGWFFYPLAGTGTINVIETASQESRIDGNMAGFTGTIIVPTSNGTSQKTDIEGGAVNWSSAASIIVSNGGTLFVESAGVTTGAWSGNAEQLGATIYVSGSGNSEGFGALRVDDAAIITGNVILQGDTVYGGTYTSPNGVSGVSGVIDDQGHGYGLFCANNNNGGQAEEFWGANTYHGATVWTNALYTLVLGNGSALQNSTLNIGPGQVWFDTAVSSNTFILGGLAGTANIVLTNTGNSPITLIVGNNNADSTFTGNLTDGGTGSAVTKIGSGTLTLAGVNGYTGLTTVSGGNLVMSTLQTNVTTGITVNDGAALTLNISGANQLAPATYTLGGSSGATNAFVNLASTSVAPVNAGSLVLNGASVINIGGGAFTVGSNYPLITYGSLSGGGSVALGSLPHGLVANLVTVGGNTIALHVSAYVPTTDLWTGNINTNWDITTTSNWLVGVSANVYYDGDITRFDDTAATANVFVKTIVSPNSVIVSNISKTYTFAGSGISGAGGLTKQGSGTLVLNLTNSYNGNTVISNGTVQLAGVNAIPGGAGKGDVLVNGTLDLNGNNDVINGLSGSGVVDTVSGGTPILNIGSSGSSTTFSGVIQNSAGTLTVTKNGSGTLTLSGNNTYSGPTLVNAGTLQVGSSTALGAGATTIASSAVLDLNGQSIGENLAPNSGATIANNSATAAAVSGNVTAANSSFTVIVGTGNITFDTITHASGSAQFDVTNLNTGTIDLAGTVDNGYLNMHVAAGTVLLDKTGAVGQRATSALFVEGGTAKLAGSTGDQIYDGNAVTMTSGTFDLNGQSETIGTLVGTGGVILNNSASTTSILTMGGVNAAGGDYFGDITDGAGKVGLTQTGSGVAQTLQGVNTYSGPTTISAGSTLTLVGEAGISNSVTVTVNGSLNISRNDGTLSLTTGQTLTGAGSVNGNVIALPGSIINPGAVNAIGTLALSDNTTLNGTLLLELNRTNTPSNCDQLTISGTPTYGGILVVTNIGDVLQVGDTFQLFPAAVSGFAGVNLPATDATGYHYTWTNHLAVDGSISVASVTSPINPLPGTIQFSVSGGAMTLSWPTNAGWLLQIQTNALTTGLYTNWVTLPGSDAVTSTNLNINPANGAFFYRMVHP
jgi:fibronectin-binding autotransporter adhesin